MKILTAAILVATATAGFCLLVNKEESIPRREVISASAVSDMPQDDADTETPNANDKLNAKISAAPRIELVRSIYIADKDVRNAAIAEVKTTVVANFGINRGILRYEPVLIEPGDIIIGDLSQPGAFAKEFQLSFLGDVSFTATETKFDPLDINNQAKWHGVLDDGDSGTIEMMIQAGEVGSPSLIIRVNAPPYYYLLFALDDMPNVSVAAEANVAYRRNMRTD